MRQIILGFILMVASIFLFSLPAQADEVKGTWGMYRGSMMTAKEF